MKYIRVVFFILWQTHTFCATMVLNDQDAFTYCMTHPQSFVAIIWPIAQGKDKEIQQIMNSYGTIQYRKDTYLTHQSAYKILHKSHPSVPFILKKAHFNWYFPPGSLKKKARIFVVKFSDASIAINCKHAIRNLFDLQYRSIHINDTHEETIEMAHFFFKHH